MIKKILLTLMLLTTSIFANEEIDTLKKEFISAINYVKVVTNKKDITDDLKNQEIIKIISPLFDFELMAKLTIGKKWKTYSKEERKLFIENYITKMKTSYSSKITTINDKKILIDETVQSKKNRIILKTSIIDENKDKFEIDYKYYKPKKDKDEKMVWLVYDVVIEGVSIIKADRHQFQEYLKIHSFKELIKILKK